MPLRPPGTHYALHARAGVRTGMVKTKAVSGKSSLTTHSDSTLSPPPCHHAPHRLLISLKPRPPATHPRVRPRSANRWQALRCGHSPALWPLTVTFWSSAGRR